MIFFTPIFVTTPFAFEEGVVLFIKKRKRSKFYKGDFQHDIHIAHRMESLIAVYFRL